MKGRERYPYLDGLRGLAVLIVVIFHAAVHLEWSSRVGQVVANIFKSGWAGVDVFFVLSGFLITGILLDTKNSPNFLYNFYIGRTLRIMPIYYLILFLTLVVMPITILPRSSQLDFLKDNQLWLWSFMTNWAYVFYRKVFTSSEWLSLDHFWSLAIEEQFYIFWPFFVLLIAQKHLIKLCTIFVLGPLVLRGALWAFEMKNGALYFPTPCRIDGLALGSLVAIGLRYNEVAERFSKYAKIATLLSIIGLVSLVFWRGGYTFTDHACVTIGITLVSIITALIIISATNRTVPAILGGFLSSRLMIAFGSCSYGLYLYHEVLRAPIAAAIPPSSLAHFFASDLIANVVWICLFIGISYSIAYLSWRFVERPILQFKHRLQRSV